MNIYSQVESADLNYDLKLIADICGIDTIRLLLQELSGLRIYIPRLSALDKFLMRYIDDNKEKSIKQIARELKISEQHAISMKKKLYKSNKQEISD